MQRQANQMLMLLIFFIYGNHALIYGFSSFIHLSDYGVGVAKVNVGRSLVEGTHHPEITDLLCSVRRQENVHVRPHLHNRRFLGGEEQLASVVVVAVPSERFPFSVQAKCLQTTTPIDTKSKVYLNYRTS